MDDEVIKKEKELALKKEKLAKKRRISKEEKRIRESYSNIPDDHMRVADGLIRRAAYMRVTLEDYEKDLDDKGYVEMFSQSLNQTPYERGRPVVQFYNTMNTNFQKIIKQLSDMLPKSGPKQEDPGNDGFEDFVNRR